MLCVFENVVLVEEWGERNIFSVHNRNVLYHREKVSKCPKLSENLHMVQQKKVLMFFLSPSYDVVFLILLT